MPRRYCSPVWWPVVLLPCCCLAGAGQPEEASRLEIIEVKAVRARQLPGSAAVIDSKTLEAVAATHPSEVAARQPGFWVSRGGGQEHLTALRSPVWTGPGACGEILFAEDGVPVRPAGFCNINQFVELDTEQAAGIEVLRGTQGGALYGSNALHGVINVLTPVFADRRALRLEAGPRDYTRLGWQHSDVDTVLALNLAHDGGYQDSSGYDQQKLLWKQRQSFGDVSLVHSLAAIHMDQQSIGYLVGDEAYRDDARQRDNPDPDAWRDVDAWRYVQHWDWQSGAWQHSVRPYLRYTAMDFTQHFNPGDPLEENGHRSLGLQWLVAHDDFGWGSWQGGAEADLAHTWTHEWQEMPSMGTSPQGEHYDYRVNTAQVAAWQELAWHWTKRLDARFGLRLDRLAYDYDSRLPAGRSGRFTRPADRSDGFTLVSPRIGLVYTATPGSEWFANASTGRRAPQTAELYRLQGVQQVADIDSVAADSGELGWRGWRDGAAWAVVLYDMHKDNVIIRNSARVLSDDARTRHRGIEFSLQQQWRNGLFAGVAATYAEHRYDSDLFDSSTGVDGRLMDSAPRTLGSVQAGWESAATRVELEWQHVGDYALNPENTFVYDGHDLLHLRAQHRLDAQWLVFARLMNLTGRDYAERADVTAFPVVEPRYFVGLPRSLFVGVEWNY